MAATPEPSAKPPLADAGCSPITLPDTPAGRRATEVLAVLDSGDAARIEAMVADQFNPAFQRMVPLATHVEVLGGVYDLTGGITACRVDFDSPTELVLLLGPARGDTFHSITMVVEAAAPHLVEGIMLETTTRAALDTPPPPLDAAARHAVIEGVAGALEDYIFADVAAAMQARIRAERDAGHYDAITHGRALAHRLTTDLREVSHDKHLTIRHSPAVISPEPTEGPQAPAPEQVEQMKAEIAKDGFGIASAEVLDGNIGYVDIRLFYPVDLVRDGFRDAMTKVADTKALIVDLRHNHGGDPATVAFATSYLFGKKKVHLNDLYYRRTNETTEYWTDPAVPGKHFGNKKPIYVLISGETFSGGEEYANNLRELGRATLIGETTGGGAHPVDGVRVDDHFMAIIPVGRAINPISKSNWEGKGVQPHVAVPAGEALDEAKARIAGKTKPGKPKPGKTKPGKPKPGKPETLVR